MKKVVPGLLKVHLNYSITRDSAPYPYLIYQKKAPVIKELIAAQDGLRGHHRSPVYIVVIGLWLGCGSYQHLPLTRLVNLRYA